MPRSGTSSHRGYGAAYRRARQRLLASNPPCHWCLQRGIVVPATTADHEPPIEVVGHPHLDLVPACGPCNFGRRPSKRPTAPPSRAW